MIRNRRRASETVNVLRKYIYRANGLSEPLDRLCFDKKIVDKNKKQHEQEDQFQKNWLRRYNEEIEKWKQEHPKEAQEIEFINSNYLHIDPKAKQVIDINLHVALLISIFSKETSGIDIKGVNEYLAGDYILFEISEIMDSILSISVSVFLKTTKKYDNLKDIADKLNMIFLSVLDYVLEKTQQLENEPKCIVSVDDNETKNGINQKALCIGQVVKNYKELCVLLGQNTTTGKSKQIQLEDFKRYFDWEKSGQKFIITDIYDTPLSKEDKRKLGNNSIYVKCIEVILLQYLSKQDKYTKTFTKRNWWEVLGMVNQKYNKIPKKHLEELDYTVTPFEIKHFYQRCNKKLEQILFSALNSLKNRKLLLYEIQTVIVKYDEDSRNEQYFQANDAHKKKILQAERYILKDVMGYEKIIQVFCRFKQDEYYRKVNARLHELYGWDHYFKQVKLIYTPEDIVEALPRIEIELQKEMLNEKIIDFLNSNAQEKYEKEKENYELACQEYIESWWGNSDIESIHSDQKFWKIPDTYLMAQSILTDELIRIGHNISFSKEEFMKSNGELDDLFLSLCFLQDLFVGNCKKFL